MDFRNRSENLAGRVPLLLGNSGGSRIKNQKTTTTNKPNDGSGCSVVGGDDSPSAPVVDQPPEQAVPTSPPTGMTAEQVSQTASWEEKLIFPNGLRDRDKTAIISHLKRCPAVQRQAVVDELAAQLNSVKAPSGYVRKLVDRALSGEFIPDADNITLAEARERRKNDFQSPLPTRRPAPSESVRAEIERLTAEMVAAQRAGDFKRYSRLGAQVSRFNLQAV